MKRVPDTWREHMPDVRRYYRERVARFGQVDAEGWASGRCPFHDDSDASLRVRLTSPRGPWVCTTCGHGDLASFHMRLRGLTFNPAVRELVRLAR